MTITETPLFAKVREAIHDAHLIAFDGCHKIYLAMDEIEADWFRENYDNVLDDFPEAMLTVLGIWWEKSCGLRFISAVRHNADDPNAGFVTLIGQGEDWEDDDEDEDEDEDY
jgi:hypothetical protein